MNKQINILGQNYTIKFENNGITYIQFHAKQLIQELSEIEGANEFKFNIVGHANINYWGGRCTPQLFIDAYEVENGKCGF